MTDLKAYRNDIRPKIVKPETTLNQSRPGSGGFSKMKFIVENNLIFSIFVLLFIPVFLYVLLCFFSQFSAGVNAYLFGVFKRPLPTKPELYFDINCINSMNYKDLIDTNQVERCRTMRPLNRIGPPRRF